MFYYTQSPIIGVDFSSFDMTKLETASRMFHYSKVPDIIFPVGAQFTSLIRADSWFAVNNTTQITYDWMTGCVFGNATSNTDISFFLNGNTHANVNRILQTNDFSHVSNLQGSFNAAGTQHATESAHLDVTNVDFSSCVNATSLFASSTARTSVDLTGMLMQSVTSMNSFFYYNSALPSIDFSVAIINQDPMSMVNLVKNCTVLTDLNINGIPFEQLTNGEGFAYACPVLDNITYTRASPTINFSNCTTFVNAFRGCSLLPNTDLLNTAIFKQDVNLSNVFHSCAAISNIQTFFDTCDLSTVKYADATFYNTGATSVDLSNLTFTSMISLKSFLQGNSSLLTVDMTNFSAPLCTTFQTFLGFCGALTTVTLTNISVPVVVSIASFIRACTSLTFCNIDQIDCSTFTNQGMHSFADYTLLWSDSQYDDALLAWSLQTPIAIGNAEFGDAKYTQTAARDVLIAAGWNMLDGGPA